MKTNKIILAGLMAVGMFFAACNENAPVYEPAQPETNEIQAYIYNTTVTSYQFTELNSAFPVVIGRNVTDVAANLTILTNDTVGAFEMDSVVSFAAGQEVDTLWITCKLGYGESYALTIDVPEEYATAYGQPTVTVNVLVDFTWLPSGVVVYQSGFWGGAQAKLPIEQAKEYTDANGNLLYRLNSPYYYVTQGAKCTKPGLHVQFLLDKDYNAVDMFDYGFFPVQDNGPFFTDGTAPINYMYWDPINYGQYCTFTNEANVYVLNIIFSDGSGLTLGAEAWMWAEGFPGELPEVEEPAEPAEPAE